MALLKVLLFVVVSSLGYTNSAFVDTLHKCSLKDSECHKELFHKIMNTLAETGAEELNIPRIDPIVIKNLNASLTNVIDFIFVEGTVKGVKDCTIDKWHIDMEHLRASIQLTCDISIKGKYVVKSTTDLLKALIGGDVHGNGTGKIKLDQLTINIGYPFTIEKRGDDFFFSSDLKKYKYSFKVHKRAYFAADKLYVRDKESSKDIIKLVNDNWSVVLETFGKHFMDVAMQYMYPFILGFFNNVPAKAYIIDDLSPYFK